MMKLVTRLALVLVPYGILVVSVNYFVDPANLYAGDRYVDGVASIMAAGHNVDNVSNYDERLLQKAVVSKIDFSPEVVVLGSSRIMELSGDIYREGRLLNCGVSHGNIQDFIAISGLLDSMRRLPSKVIIAVDPSAFERDGSDEWHSILEFHRYATKNILHTKFNYPDLPLSSLSKLRALLSFDYFEKAIMFLSKGGSKTYHDVGTKAPRSSGRLADGAVAYQYEYMHPDTIKMASDAAEDGRKNGMANVDDDNFELFARLVEGLRRSQCEIVLVMVPYHPQYFEAVNQKSMNVLIRSESLFKEFASRMRVPIMGSFDPAKFHLAAGDFYDRWHCNRQVIVNIFSSTEHENTIR
jgi:hypothetical protein